MHQNKYLIKKSQLIIDSGSLIDIKLFQINENFFELPGGVWIIDGGIELQFANGTICFGWNQDLDSFDFNISKFKDLYKDSNYVELKTDKMNELLKLKDYKVVNYNFRSQDFDFIIDYTMKTKKESRLVEIKLDFEDGSELKLASVGYQIKPNMNLEKFYFDTSQELLISLNRSIEIE